MTAPIPLIDRAADALRRCENGGFGFFDLPDFETLIEPAKAAYREKARAVARVILEEPPSPTMLAAWHDAYPPPGKHMDDDYPQADWSAMASTRLADLSPRPSFPTDEVNDGTR